MQKLIKVQRKNGSIEELPDWMANDQKLQRKHGWRVINVPETVEELKAEVHPFEQENNQTDAELVKIVTDGQNDGQDVQPKKRGRKPKQ